MVKMNGMMGKGKMNEGEISDFVEKGGMVVEGFWRKEGKSLGRVVEVGDEGGVNMECVMGRCGECGGEVGVGRRGLKCWK